MWVPKTDQIVFRSDRNGKLGMWLVRFKDGQSMGEPRLIKPDAGDFRPEGVSQDGSVFYRLENRATDVYQAIVDPQTLRVQGTPARVVDSYLGRNLLPVWSPSGDSFAYYSERDIGGDFRPVIRSSSGNEVMARGISVRNRTSFPNTPLRWCSDGGSLALLEGLRFRIFDSRTGDAKHPDRFLFRPPDAGVVAVESAVGPDCESVFAWVFQPGGERRKFGRYEVATGKETELLSDSGGAGVYSSAVSPDGRWFAFREALGGDKRTRIALLPTTGGPSRTLATGDLVRLSWTPDSKRLIFSQLYTSPDGQRGSEMFWVSVDGGVPQSTGIRVPDPLAPAPSLHPDGKRLLYSFTETSSELWVVRNLVTK
ncbi:MAG: PD40 domain-containing protein [Bryobacterales bacterium]|nr:PD40 domain-containing protein [Bryobacterales bacterium]